MARRYVEAEDVMSNDSEAYCLMVESELICCKCSESWTSTPSFIREAVRLQRPSPLESWLIRLLNNQPNLIYRLNGRL